MVGSSERFGLVGSRVCWVKSQRNAIKGKWAKRVLKVAKSKDPVGEKGLVARWGLVLPAGFIGFGMALKSVFS